MVIYKTTNTLNGKFYIGKDEKNNPNYLGSGLKLVNAIKKYGKENFKKEILQECATREELNVAERKWISELSAIELGYNLAHGGDGGKTREFPWNKGLNKNDPKIASIGEKNRLRLLGSKQTEATKKKRRETLTGQTRSDETKNKISNALRGKTISKEVREKISNTLSGRKLPEEVVKKMQEKKLTDEHKRKISEGVKRKRNKNE